MGVAQKLSLNTATVREQWDLRACVEGCARHGFGGIAPWRDKLEPVGVSQARRMFDDAGLMVTSLCRGGFFTTEGPYPGWMQDDNRKAVDEAAEIGAQCLVLVVGGLVLGSTNLADARARVEEEIARLLEHSRKMGVRLAIEPLHPMYAADRACVNTIGQALDISDRLRGEVGVVVDVYHTWWDPDLASSIARSGKDRLLGFHICDWLVPTTDMLLDRGMMGDGVIEIDRIGKLVCETGFDGLWEVEIFSARNWWREDPDHVLATIVERSAGLIDT